MMDDTDSVEGMLESYSADDAHCSAATSGELDAIDVPGKEMVKRQRSRHHATIRMNKDTDSTASF